MSKTKPILLACAGAGIAAISAVVSAIVTKHITEEKTTPKLKLRPLTRKEMKAYDEAMLAQGARPCDKCGCYHPISCRNESKCCDDCCGDCYGCGCEGEDDEDEENFDSGFTLCQTPHIWPEVTITAIFDGNMSTGFKQACSHGIHIEFGIPGVLIQSEKTGTYYVYSNDALYAIDQEIAAQFAREFPVEEPEAKEQKKANEKKSGKDAGRRKEEPFLS